MAGKQEARHTQFSMGHMEVVGKPSPELVSIGSAIGYLSKSAEVRSESEDVMMAFHHARHEFVIRGLGRQSPLMPPFLHIFSPIHTVKMLPSMKLTVKVLIDFFLAALRGLRV